MTSGAANWGTWKPAEAPLDRLLDIRQRMLRLSRIAAFRSLAAPWRAFGAVAASIWHSPERLVSCGDAAGLVEPFSGEGIWAALTSGSAAGAAMASYFSGCAGALENYSRWVGDTFGASYARYGERAAFWRTNCRRIDNHR
jgi:flavin-dependent dehydrogenase